MGLGIIGAGLLGAAGGYGRGLQDEAKSEISDIKQSIRDRARQAREDNLRTERREYQKGLTAESREYQKGLTKETREYQEGKTKETREYQEGRTDIRNKREDERRKELWDREDAKPKTGKVVGEVEVLDEYGDKIGTRKFYSYEDMDNFIAQQQDQGIGEEVTEGEPEEKKGGIVSRTIRKLVGGPKEAEAGATEVTAPGDTDGQNFSDKVKQVYTMLEGVDDDDELQERMDYLEKNNPELHKQVMNYIDYVEDGHQSTGGKYADEFSAEKGIVSAAQKDQPKLPGGEARAELKSAVKKWMAEKGPNWWSRSEDGNRGSVRDMHDRAVKAGVSTLEFINEALKNAESEEERALLMEAKEQVN